MTDAPGGFAPGEVIAAGEVASLLRADPRTVIAWDASGKLPALLRTPHGHRRWHRAQVEAFRAGLPGPVIILPALPGLMTTPEVAAQFGASQQAVRLWAADGLLPGSFLPPGGKWRHLGDAVAALMRGERRGGKL
jgi:hypothetical protein